MQAQAVEEVILVNELDKPIGTMEKLSAHRQGLCHRAFSVFVFKKENQSIELLLQQRAQKKYHSANLWTNTCCSHPRPSEDILSAAKRRLKEELGLSIALQVIDQFHYIATLENGLIENEIDHVLIGFYQGEPISLNPHEVAATQWIALPQLKKELQASPHLFTPWFKTALHIAENAIY